MNKQKSNIKTKDIIYISLFVTIIYISGLIRLNIFSIPFTLQTFAVMLTACFLGAKKGLFVVLIYIFSGLIGLPVFTKGGGIFYVLEPTFGYIIAFIPAVLFIGFNKNKIKNIYMFIVLLFVAGIIMLFIGSIYVYILLSFSSGIKLSVLINGYFLLFIPAELVKSILAAIIYYRLKRFF